MDRHRKTGQVLIIIIAHQVYQGRGGHAVFQLHADAQQVQLVLGHDAGHRHFVGLIHLVTGMGHGLGQFPVVSEKQQPFCIVIQPPYRVYTLGNILDKIRNGFAAFRVFHGSHHAPGLVKQQVRLAFPVHGMPVYRDERVGPNLGAQFFHYLAVHLYAPGRNIFFRFPAGSHAGRSQHFL